MKKSMTLVLTLLLMVVFTASALASAIAILDFGASATKSGTSLIASAVTEANQVADSVGGTMYLQRYDYPSGSWVNQSSSSFSSTNSATARGSKTWTVSLANRYRVKCVHTATLNGTTATKTYYTSAIDY